MKKHTSFGRNIPKKMNLITPYRNKEGVFEIPGGGGYVVRIKVKSNKTVTCTTISKHTTKEEAELKYASLITD